MPDCSHCHQTVPAHAIICPHCRTALKAFGHPGIPLHRAVDETYLCETCSYHADDSCNFPQRPYARECTLYQNQTQLPEQRYTPRSSTLVRGWLQQNAVWLVVAGLLGFSLVLALSNR